jgi:phosphoglycerate dehydrogenase-like enzyme
MSALPRVLALLTPEEQQEFFPGSLWTDVQAVAAAVQVINPRELNPDQLRHTLAEVAPTVLVACWSAPILSDKLPASLSYICYLCGSIKRLATREQIERGLLVTNWGTSISRTIAEAALLHVLSALRRTTHWTLSLHRERGWLSPGIQPQSLFGRRVGLHGFGAIARELVALLRPFGCTVSAFAPDLDATTQAKFDVLAAPSLEVLFSESDVIVEVAPLIPATRGIVNEALLRRIRPGGVFVNVGRGAVVDEAALARVAREGRIQVGLDVFEPEPLPVDSPLRGLANVSLTPHIAGPTPDRRRDAGAFALRNVRAFAAGGPLEAVITPEVYDWTT